MTLPVLSLLFALLFADWPQRMREANRLQEQSRFDEARQAYEALLAQAERFEPSDHRRADVHNNLGAHYFQSGRYADAERQYSLALETWKLGYATESTGFALTLNNTGTLYRVTGRPAEAITVLRRAIAILERNDDLPRLQTSVMNLSEAYRAAGDFGQARDTAEHALKLAQAMQPPDDLRLAHSLHALGNAYQNAGATAQARQAYEQSVQIREQRLGPEHPLVGATLANLASQYLNDRRLEEASATGERAVAILRTHFPNGHPNLISALNNLAQVRRVQGRAIEAEPLYRAAIEMSDRTLGRTHPDSVKLRGNLAEFLFERGQLQAAITLYDRAIETYASVGAGEHPYMATLQAGRAVVLVALRRYTEAEALLRTWIPVLEQKLGPQSPRTIQSAEAYALLLRRTGRRPEATLRSFAPAR